MMWQVNWGSWGLQWVKTQEDYYYDMSPRPAPMYSNWIIIGPLQMHWWSS